MREALTNAVSARLPRRSGQAGPLLFAAQGPRLLIAVEDDGEGFDWRAAGTNTARFRSVPAEVSRSCGSMRNRVRYNERGNAVTMIKRF